MKKVLMLVYDSFAEFEVSILITCLKGEGILMNTFTVNQDKDYVTSIGNLKILPDYNLDEVNCDHYDALIIPGGTPYPLLGNEQLASIIKEFYLKEKIIGAICGGPALLGASGILDKIQYTASLTKEDDEYVNVLNWSNKKEAYLVNDRNVITSTGSNYIQFAVEVLRALGARTTDEKEPLKYFKEPSLN